MFFIMGVSQGEKKLDFDQLVICGHCGRYGHLNVYMVYSYLSLFFIPVFKWGRRYYVRTSCCDTTVELDGELGRQIASGQITRLPEDVIPQRFFDQAQKEKHRCGACGFETEADFQFCPKCGAKLQ
ncbi:MAG: zinc ribbon domain-containing protein [Lachnospiraceae bacterium]|nr:zinc ribbon domain-containing protein [Lachnospiraceae bacterium]